MVGAFGIRAIVVLAGLAALAGMTVPVPGRLAGVWPAPASAGAATAEAGVPQPVRVMRVALVAPEQLLRFTGTVQPYAQTAMAFRLPGKIVSRAVEVGDRVLPGQILARIDTADGLLNLKAAEAEVTAASADLTRVRSEADRARSLNAAGNAAKAVLDAAVSTAAEAQGRFDRASRARDLAANALSYMALTADASGVGTTIAAEPGQIVAAGQPVVTLAQTDALDVVFVLPEQMRAVVEGRTASARLWGEDGHCYALTLRDIAPDVDPVGRTYRVRMALTEPDAATALGRTMIVTLADAGQAPVVALPLAAVVNDG
jgi:RND family efflux transporter MFP subunit